MTVRTSLCRMLAAALLCCGLAACGGAENASEGTAEERDGTMNVDSTAAGAVATDDGTVSSDNEGPDICRLLSAQEAGDILGFKVAEGTRSNGSCGYELVPPSMAGLVVTQVSGSGAYDVLVDDKWETIPGIGDKAAFLEGGLIFQKGESVISVSVINPKEGYKTREPLMKIAQTLVGRMQ